MKKFVSLVIIIAILCSSVFALAACSETTDDILRVHNWQDYMYEAEDKNDKGVNDLFCEYYYKKTNRTIKIEYSTFGTNEDMYNDIKSGREFDLVAPSEYMIEKMANEGLLEKYNGSLNNYDTYGSQYIKDLFASIPVKGGGTVADYAVGYMWGTMGFLYNPERMNQLGNESDISSWLVMWNSAYKRKVTSKNSLREAYFAGLAYVYNDELVAAANQYKNNTLTTSQYQSKLNQIFGRTDADTIAKVEAALKELNKNIYGYEVDSGKNDMVNKNLAINYAWSGDAVYAMDLAEENEIELAYQVPVEGSNVWFDGWVMPKNAQVAIATMYVDFLCDPDIAIKNMDYIGFTSAIAGQKVFDRVVDLFGSNEHYGNSDYAVDLGYFFSSTVNGNTTVYSNSINRQLSAQYPDQKIINRCVIMRDFGDDTQAIVDMWGRIKAVDIGTIILIIAIGIAAIVGIFFLVRLLINGKNKRRKLVSKSK